MKAIVTLILIVAYSFSVAQTGYPSYPGDPLNYYTIKADREKYFSDLKEQFGEEELYEEGSPYSEFQKWKEYWEPRLAPHGCFELFWKQEATYVKEHKKNGLEKSNTDPWYEVGPTTKPQCTLTTIGGGALGIGPIKFIQINPANANQMFAGAEGGLFYSNDKGLNWDNANTDVGWNYSSCQWASFDPFSSTTWYGANRDWIGYTRGMWRSTDSGTTWSHIGNADDFGGGYAKINKFIIDPNNAGVAYVATTFGIYKTTNINATNPTLISWSKVYPTSGILPIYDIEIKPSNPDVIYAGIGMHAGLGNNGIEAGYSALVPGDLIVSSDNGNTWSQVPSFPSVAGCTRISIEVTEDSPSKVFCLFITSPTAAQLYSYNSSGNVWTNLSTPNNPTQYGAGHAFGVSNFNSNIIMLANSLGCQRSTDGGLSWTYLTPGTMFHVDMEDFVTASTTCSTCTNDFWMANHGGLYYSADAGLTWEDKSNGLGVAFVKGMSTSYTTPSRIAVGLYHDGTLISDGTYGPNWTPTWCTVHNGDGLQPLIDRSNSNNALYSNQGGPYSKTTNYSVATSSTAFSLGDWHQYITQSPQDPNVLYSRIITGTDKVDVNRSMNFGTSVQTISNFGVAPYNYANYLPWRVYTCPSDPNRLYIHLNTDNASQFRVYTVNNALDPTPANIASNWVECTVPQINKWMGGLAVDINNPLIAYMAYPTVDPGINGTSGGVIYKVDYTSSFVAPTITDISYNLPSTNGLNIVTEKGTNGGMYIHTDNGVWYTDYNRLANSPVNSKWVKIGNNIPELSGTFNSIEVNYEANMLRIATDGRGVWEHHLFCPSSTDINHGNFVHTTGTYTEVQNNITSIATVANGTTVKYRGGNKITLSPGFRANSGSSFQAFIHGCDHPGNSFKRLEHPGIEYGEDQADFEHNSDGVLLFPNPTQSDINVVLDKSFSGTVSMDILDINGKIIKSKKVVCNSDRTVFDFDTAQLPNGIYIVNIFGSEKQIQRRFVKY